MGRKKRYLTSVPRLAVIGVSDWVTDIAKSSPFLANAKMVKRIYNWIDLDVFYKKDSSAIRRKLGLDGKIVILGVASIWQKNDRKGLDTYIKLAKVLPNDYCVVLVGRMNYDGSLPKNIIVYGKTNNTSELAELYSLANVYLNLSKEETFGKVSAEAISCGTPVVAIDSTANKEIVPPKAGVLLHSESIQEILDGIK